MRSRGLALIVFLLSPACSGDEPSQILDRWRYVSERPLTAATHGTEDRIIVSERENPAQFLTLREQDGAKLEGPFDVFPAVHAPVAVGNDIFLATSIGRIVHTDVGGQTLDAPDVMLGGTAPMVAAPDGTLRIASTAGRLLGFDKAGTILFDTTFVGAPDTAPAVDEAGVTYVGTDAGGLHGFDATGAMVFDVDLPGQVSGPSVSRTVVAAGHADGLSAFEKDGTEIFNRPRAARVTGTKILASGEILAWGEDGAVELLDENGGVIMSYIAGPPIYAPVLPVDENFAVVDNDGTAHLVGRDGTAKATLALGGTPQRQFAVATTNMLQFVYVTIDKTLIAVDFTSRK